MAWTFRLMMAMFVRLTAEWSLIRSIKTEAQHEAGRASLGPRLNPVSNTPLNMRFTNVPLTRILSFIGSVTGIAITYENGYVDIPKVTIDVKEATLEEALNQILTPNRLSYKVVDEPVDSYSAAGSVES